MDETLFLLESKNRKILGIKKWKVFFKNTESWIKRTELLPLISNQSIELLCNKKNLIDLFCKKYYSLLRNVCCQYHNGIGGSKPKSVEIFRN